MRRLESSIEVAFGQWLFKLSDGAWLYFKWYSEDDTGWPDRWLVGPGGRIVFVEWKRNGEEPEPLQARRIEQLKRRGHRVYVWDHLPTAKREFAAYLRAEGLPKRGY